MMIREKLKKFALTLLRRPYVRVTEARPSVGGKPGLHGIKLDWNGVFVRYLRDNGYAGGSDEEIMYRWLSDNAKSVSMEVAYANRQQAD